jgi:hypothetical protein
MVKKKLRLLKGKTSGNYIVALGDKPITSHRTLKGARKSFNKLKSGGK